MSTSTADWFKANAPKQTPPMQAQPADDWFAANAPQQQPAAPPPQQSQDWRDALAQRLNEVVPGSQPVQDAQGRWGSAPAQGLGSSLGQIVGNVGTHLKNMVAGPYHAMTDPLTLNEIAQNPSGLLDNPLMRGAWRMAVEPSINNGMEAAKQYKAGNNQEGLRNAVNAIPILGPWGQQLGSDAAQKGIPAAAAGLLTDMEAPKVALRALGGAAQGARTGAASGAISGGTPGAILGGAKGALTGGAIAAVPDLFRNAAGNAAGKLTRWATIGGADLDAPAEPGGLSPRDLYNVAKDNGIQFDAAQALGKNAPWTITVPKRVTEFSLGGRNVFDQAANANRSALPAWGDRLGDEATPVNQSYEQFGDSGQNVLAQNQPKMVDQAKKIYERTSDQYGSEMVAPTNLQSAAGGIIADNENYYRENPDALGIGGTGRVWKQVNRYAPPPEALEGDEAPGVFDMPQSAMVSAPGKLAKPLNLFGYPDTAEAPASGSQPLSDLFKLRSDLMSDYRSPDLVGTRAEGFQKQMVGGLDKDIMGALPPDGQQDFRNANNIWEQMQDTYQNPSSPFTQMLRSSSPSQVANSLLRMTPEATRTFKAATEATGMQPVFDQLQRQKISSILDPKNTGNYDFKGLATRNSRLNSEQLGEMLTDSQREGVNNLSQTARVLNSDTNPSGSGKVLQATGEVGGLAGLISAHPQAGAAAAAWIPASYGIAKALNSPKFVDFLMSKPGPGSNVIDMPTIRAAMQNSAKNAATLAPLKRGALGANAVANGDKKLSPDQMMAIRKGWSSQK